MKKILLILLVFASAVFLTGCAKRSVPADKGTIPTVVPTALPTKSVEESINERPFVSLTPSSDGHWLTWEIKNIPKGTTGLEYELIYFAEVGESRIERGLTTGGRPIELGGKTEYSKKELLGTASCTTGTCKYKYDENVNEGTLTFTLISTDGRVKYDSVFRIQKGKEAKEAFTAGDGVFSLMSTNIPANSLYVTISSVGIPLSLPQGVIAKTNPYGIFPNISGNGKVSFKTALTAGDIYAYSGKSWSKLTTTFAGGKATADFSNSSLFILGQ